jgi:hypothetical protein
MKLDIRMPRRLRAATRRLTQEPRDVLAAGAALVALIVVAVPAASGTTSSTSGLQMLTAARPQPATFYPYVHDGYRDTTQIRLFLDNYDPNVACDTGAYTVRIVDEATDAAVRTWTSPFSGGSRGLRLAWDGRDDRGALVPAGGRYAVDATVAGQCRYRADNSAAYPFSLDVRPRTDIVTATRFRNVATSLSRRGGDATGGGCSAGALGCVDQARGPQWWLQAGGSGTASVWYDFPLPAGAGHLSCHVDLAFSAGHVRRRCAVRGRVARVTVSAPRGAAALVDGATLTYRVRASV